MTSTPLGRGLIAGAVCAVGIAAISLVRGDSLGAGLVSGVIVGGVLGGLSGLDMRRQLGDVLAMPRADREAIVQTVRKGAPVTDVRLAPAVATYAGALRRQRGTAWDKPVVARLVYGFLAVLCGYVAVVDALEGEVGQAVVGGLVAATWAAMVYVGPWQQQRRQQRLERVERSAQALIAAGGSAD